jgi:hypothetical protein
MEFPTGIDWVLVNGIVTIDHGRHTGAKAGQVLRGPGYLCIPNTGSTCRSVTSLERTQGARDSR